ncbi:MAG: ATP synthase subunit I [Mariprofundus sp.]|nr:ATP synthase subunit I [Mariprofundus sp.]
MSLKNDAVLRSILRQQLMFGAFGFFALVSFSQMLYGVSFFIGVLMMTVNGWWLAKRFEKTTGLSVESSQRSLYAGAAVRFLALIAGLVLAHLIGLHLLLVAVGMFVAQAVVFVSALFMFGKKSV